VTPLFRYVLLKTFRQRFLTPMITTPALLTGAPVAGLMVRDLILGRPMRPFALPGGVPTEVSVGVFAYTATLFAALAAGIAAFWIFRDEIIDRSVAAFILATRPFRISLTALVCGMAAGALAFVFALSVLALLTWSVPPKLEVIAAVFVGSAAFAAALAVFLAAFSPEPGMLFPMMVLTGPVSILLFARSVPAAAFVAAVVIFLPLIAGIVLERRCAG
jgi:hypothetical protein